MVIYGVIFSKFDPKEGPVASEFYPEKLKKILSKQQLANIALQSMGVYDTSNRSFNVFTIKGEIRGVSYAIKVIDEEFERRMAMFSVTVVTSYGNSSPFKGVLLESLINVAKSFKEKGNFSIIPSVLHEVYNKVKEIAETTKTDF